MLNLWISIGSADVSLHKKNLYLTFAFAAPRFCMEDPDPQS